MGSRLKEAKQLRLLHGGRIAHPGDPGCPAFDLMLCVPPVPALPMSVCGALRTVGLSGVVDALRGYANPDGGFGHGLEPDSRCPESLPIDVEVALQTLVAAKATDTHLLMAACGYLERVAEEAGSAGAVPLALPAIENYPRGCAGAGVCRRGGMPAVYKKLTDVRSPMRTSSCILRENAPFSQ